MPKRAYFVIGSEGSGTNMLAEAFVSAGCHYEPWHAGQYEYYRFGEMSSPFIFRRSLPHAGFFPDLLSIRGRLRMAGFRVWPVLVVRDWRCTVQSVMRRDSTRDPRTIEKNMRNGMALAFNAFADLIYVSYESFCLHPEFRRWLFCERLGLPEPTLEIHYANPKYYEGGEAIWDESETIE